MVFIRIYGIYVNLWVKPSCVEKRVQERLFDVGLKKWTPVLRVPDNMVLMSVGRVVEATGSHGQSVARGSLTCYAHEATFIPQLRRLTESSRRRLRCGFSGKRKQNSGLVAAVCLFPVLNNVDISVEVVQNLIPELALIGHTERA